MQTYTNYFRNIICDSYKSVDLDTIETVVQQLYTVKQLERRVFVLGLGGSAANASHMCNDLRKICGIESYTPTDNVAELTARINDDGWDSCLTNYLRVSRLYTYDSLFFLSVGGGDSKTSRPLVHASKYAAELSCYQTGIIGRTGGELKSLLTDCIHIPNDFPMQVTPIVESLQAVIWHCIVTHPIWGDT